MSFNRGRGRPKRSESPVDRERIIETAIELLRQRRRPISLRAIASSLNVDPMTLYTYFSDKKALEEELATRLMSSFYIPRSHRAWKVELRALIVSYINLLIEHRGLLETVVRLGVGAQGPAKVFRERFLTAVSALRLPSRDVDAALHLIVDYVHGFVLAFERTGHGTLRAEQASAPLEFYLSCVDLAAEET